MNDKTTSTRHENIDFLRGIGIIAVILGHTAYFLLKKGMFDSTVGTVIYTVIYSFHMPLFFAISGYVCNFKREERLLKQIGKDLISLYVPFLFLNCIYYIERVIAYSFGVSLDNSIDVSFVGALRLFYTAYGEAWFLLSLLMVKILFDVLIHFGKAFITVPVFIILFALSVAQIGGWPVEYLGWGIFYVLGYLVFVHEKVILSKKVPFVIGSVLSIAIGCGIFYYIGGLSPVVKLFVGSGVFVFLFILMKEIGHVPFINTFGKNSLMIYVFHGFIQSPVFIIVSREFTSQYMLFIMLILLQWLIIWMIWLLMNKSKLFMWMQYIFHPTWLCRKR